MEPYAPRAFYPQLLLSHHGLDYGCRTARCWFAMPNTLQCETSGAPRLAILRHAHCELQWGMSRISACCKRHAPTMRTLPPTLRQQHKIFKKHFRGWNHICCLQQRYLQFVAFSGFSAIPDDSLYSLLSAMLIAIRCISWFGCDEPSHKQAWPQDAHT